MSSPNPREGSGEAMRQLLEYAGSMLDGRRSTDWVGARTPDGLLDELVGRDALLARIRSGAPAAVPETQLCWRHTLHNTELFVHGNPAHAPGDLLMVDATPDRSTGRLACRRSPCRRGRGRRGPVANPAQADHGTFVTADGTARSPRPPSPGRTTYRCVRRDSTGGG